MFVRSGRVNTSFQFTQQDGFIILFNNIAAVKIFYTALVQANVYIVFNKRDCCIEEQYAASLLVIPLDSRHFVCFIKNMLVIQRLPFVFLFIIFEKNHKGNLLHGKERQQFADKFHLCNQSYIITHGTTKAISLYEQKAIYQFVHECRTCRLKKFRNQFLDCFVLILFRKIFQ